MFLSDRSSAQARALEVWHEAASLVSLRWSAFVAAEPVTRRWAFVSYVAALDAEEAASRELEALSLRRAA
jgi:hypothetical protein